MVNVAIRNRTRNNSDEHKNSKKKKNRKQNSTGKQNAGQTEKKNRKQNSTGKQNAGQTEKKEQKTEQYRETERRTNRKIIVMNIKMVNVAIRNRTRNNSDEHKNGKRRNKE